MSQRLAAAAAGPAQGLAHYPALDGLRAIAVLLVLYNHAPVLMGHGDERDGAFWHGSKGAWIGVDLFFVLSGFLITTILLHARGKPHAFRRFWIRRALRIFPLAYAYLGVLALVGWLLPGFTSPRDQDSFAWASVYLLNFQIAENGWGAPEFGLLWSLAVEEHFYLLWPLCVLRTSRRTVLATLIAVVAVTPFVRLLLLDRIGQVGVYVTTWCRWDTLAFGALLAIAWNSPRREWVRRFGAWLALPATAFVVWVVATPVPAVHTEADRLFPIVGYTLLAVAFTAWCALALDPPQAIARVLGHRALTHIGRISYGLYVWHVLTAHLTPRICKHLPVPANLTVYVMVWFVVLFATASISYRFFEAPLLRLKDRLT